MDGMTMDTRFLIWAAVLVAGSYGKWEVESTDTNHNTRLPNDHVTYTSDKEIRNRVSSHTEFVLNYTQGIKDEFAKFLISSFLIHCPDIPLCYDDGRFYKYYSFLSEGKVEFPACRSCSCADDCERKNECCISRYTGISQRNKTANEDDNSNLQPQKTMTQLVCKRTQVGVIKIDNVNLPYATHWIITECPSRPGSIIWRKCKKYLSTDELRNEKLHRPVTSFKTNDSYQNEYCAKCFGENHSDLFPWKRVLFTNTKEELNRDGNQFLGAYDEKSMISYEPPTFLKDSLRCTLPKIKKCNVTGKWNRYDERLIWACEKIPFSSLYHAYTITSLYKNVFCALCNIPKFDDGHYYSQSKYLRFGNVLIPHLGVFAELLKFSKAMEVRDYRIESRCQNEEIFSPKLKQCLPVVCKFGYVQQGPKCQSISSILSKTIAWVDAALCSKRSLDSVLFRKIRSNDTIVFQDIKKHLINHIYLHSKTFFVIFFYPVIQSLNEICYPLRIHLHSGILINEVVFRTSFLSFLKNVSFNDTLSLRHLQFRLIHRQRYLNIVDHFVKHHFITTSQLPAHLMHITEQHNCPRIHLTDGYHINFTLFEVCIAEYDVCFESHLMGVNDDGIFLCLDTYKQIINEYMRKLNDEVSSETYLSVVSLSVSSFCCLLAVTRYLVLHNTFPVSLKLKMSLCFSLFLANTLYTSTGFFTHRYQFCMVFGILSHYLWLLVLGFMSLLSFDLFISILGSLKLKGNRTVWAYVISNSTICAMVVTIHIRLSFETSGGSSLGYSKTTCFIENGQLKLFTLVLPIMLMVALNTICFIATIYCIRKRMISSKSREKLLIKLLLKISSVTGVAWIFGFTYELTDELFFAHIHSFFTGCIGVFIFFLL